MLEYSNKHLLAHKYRRNTAFVKLLLSEKQPMAPYFLLFYKSPFFFSQSQLWTAFSIKDSYQFKSCNYQLFAEWPWKSYLVYLAFHFLTCKIEITIVPASLVCPTHTWKTPTSSKGLCKTHPFFEFQLKPCLFQEDFRFTAALPLNFHSTCLQGIT